MLSFLNICCFNSKQVLENKEILEALIDSSLNIIIDNAVSLMDSSLCDISNISKSILDISNSTIDCLSRELPSVLEVYETFKEGRNSIISNIEETPVIVEDIIIDKVIQHILSDKEEINYEQV